MNHPIYSRSLLNKKRLCFESILSNVIHIRVADEAKKESPLVRYGIFKRDWEKNSNKITEQADRLTCEGEDFKGELKLDLSEFRIKDNAGKIIIETAEPMESGESGGFKLSIKLKKGERLYGLGDISRDCIQKRGTRAMMWVTNVASYVPLPTLLSSEGWGLVLGTTWKHFFDLGKADPDKLKIWSRKGDLDVYFFTGKNLQDLLNTATRITGRPALLPQWAYGLTFVCNQQANARDMVDDALNLRKAGIPCDVIGLEPGWMDSHYNYSTKKKWHDERFYIPSWVRKPGDINSKVDNTFVGAINRLGFKLSLWLCQDYDLSYEEERRAGAKIEHGKVVKTERHPDDFEQDEHFGHGPIKQDTITNPDEPWFEHLKQFVTDGARAFKLDGALQVNEHPDRKWANGMEDEEMHNLYPAIYNKQMALGFREFIGKRPLIYSAGGYSGIQQYSATWAGDTGGGSKPLVSMINHGLSGHVNTSCDMEVFSIPGIHFGFFQPWSQVCSWAYWRHPWLLGDKLLSIFQFYCKLRYSLIPYIYSTAHVAHQTGLPILRGLPLHHPDSQESDQRIFQYYFGEFFLTGAFSEDFWLPEGCWYDYWNNQMVEGGKVIRPVVPEDRGGPLFIKEGALIPRWPEMDYVGQKDLTKIFLDVYPGKTKTSFTLYEDDGESFAFERGEVATTLFEFQGEQRGFKLHLGSRKGTYEGMPQKRVIQVGIPDLGEKVEWTLNQKPCPVIKQDGKLICEVEEISGDEQLLIAKW